MGWDWQCPYFEIWSSEMSFFLAEAGRNLGQARADSAALGAHREGKLRPAFTRPINLKRPRFRQPDDLQGLRPDRLVTPFDDFDCEARTPVAKMTPKLCRPPSGLRRCEA